MIENSSLATASLKVSFLFQHIAHVGAEGVARLIGDFNHGANPGFVLLIDGHVFELLAAVFDFAEVRVKPDVQPHRRAFAPRFD